jgi:hypothetical protein
MRGGDAIVRARAPFAAGGPGFGPVASLEGGGRDSFNALRFALRNCSSGLPAIAGTVETRGRR